MKKVTLNVSNEDAEHIAMMLKHYKNTNYNTRLFAVSIPIKDIHVEAPEKRIPFKPGTPIKVKDRTFGVLGKSTGWEGNYYYTFHNGMKPSTNIASVSDIKIISSEKFEAYIKRSGNTALRTYLK